VEMDELVGSCEVEERSRPCDTRNWSNKGPRLVSPAHSIFDDIPKLPKGTEHKVRKYYGFISISSESNQ
jgi:hypothetical protein